MTIEEIEVALYILGARRNTKSLQDQCMYYKDNYVTDMRILASQIARGVDSVVLFDMMAKRVREYKKIHGE